MSKRESAELSKDGHSIFVTDLREMGYLPEAVNNWVALMGWSFDGSSEFFRLEDLVEKFSLEHLNPSPAAINFAKFDHFNGLHIRALSSEELAARIKPFFNHAGIQVDDATLVRIAPLIRERITTLDEAVDFAAFFFKPEIEPDPQELIAKGLTAAQSLQVARRSLEVLAGLEDFSPASAEPPMRMLVEELDLNPGQVFGVLRVAITGQRVSPPLFESMEIVGKERLLERIARAIKMLEDLV
jgi:glutamyl-tRNA synthetase